MIKFKFRFIWNDLWIGAFLDPEKGALHICPLPCCSFTFYWKEHVSTLIEPTSIQSYVSSDGEEWDKIFDSTHPIDQDTLRLWMAQYAPKNVEIIELPEGSIDIADFLANKPDCQWADPQSYTPLRDFRIMQRATKIMLTDESMQEAAVRAEIQLITEGKIEPK